MCEARFWSEVLLASQNRSIPWIFIAASKIYSREITANRKSVGTIADAAGDTLTRKLRRFGFMRETAQPAASARARVPGRGAPSAQTRRG